MKPRFSWFVLLGAVVAFGIGLWHLFDLRFSTGDVYPEGSTLRADPLGSRAFYESLALLGGRSVTRSLEPLSTIHARPDKTLFLLAVDPEDRWLSRRDRETVDNLLAAGGRVVVSFASPPSRGTQTNISIPAKAASNPATSAVQTALEAWGLRLDHPSAAHGPDLANEAERSKVAPPFLPAQIPWPSTAAFTGLTTNWTVLYSCYDGPVIIERARGRGSLVLLADNWLLTNEALRRDRAPLLLAWLVGPNSRLVFDETHLGTRLEPGVMTLLRRYGLTGFLLGLLLVAGLYVWRATMSLVPRAAEGASKNREVVTGRDSTAGFTNLLRRSIPPAELISVCLSEWRQSVPRDRADLRRKAAEMQDLVNLEMARPRSEKNPVLRYRQLAEILGRR
jgi:hypothetical protein